MVTFAPTGLFVECCLGETEQAFAPSTCTAPRPSMASNLEYLDYAAQLASLMALFVLDLCLLLSPRRVLARQLRQLAFDAETLFVILSSSTDPRDTQFAKRCGADDYYVEPVIADGSRRVIERIAIRWLPLTR